MSSRSDSIQTMLENFIVNQWIPRNGGRTVTLPELQDDIRAYSDLPTKPGRLKIWRVWRKHINLFSMKRSIKNGPFIIIVY